MTFHLTALYEIAASRPHSPIFPRLRHIQGFRGSSTFEILFLQSGPATSLEILGSRSSSLPYDLPCPSTSAALFDRILDRLPSPRRLKLDAPKKSNETVEFATEIPRLIEKFTALTVVTLTPSLLTPAVISSLARLPYLLSIEMPTEDFGTDKPKFYNLKLADVVLEPGSFPSLREISLSAPLQQAQTFFTHKNFPLASLTKMSFHSSLEEVALVRDPQVHNFLSMLAPSCQNLQQLEFSVDAQDDLKGDSSWLTFRNISPVLDFPALKRLTLIHDYTIEMTDKEGEALAMRWPTLEELVLNPCPRYPDGYEETAPIMTLNAVIPFCRHCPNLRRLALHVDAVAPVIVPTNISALRPLLSFDMGSSRLPSSQDQKGWDAIHGTLPRFFARVLRNSSSLRFGRSFDRFCDIPKEWKFLRSLVSLVMEELWEREKAVKEAREEVMRQFTSQQ